MPASVVVGQPDFSSSSANQGLSNPTSNTLSSPVGMTVVGNKFIVADFVNNRVLVFNSIPSANNTSADVVIGQSDFTGKTVNQGGTAAANTLSGPISVDTDGQKLFIADTGNNRVLIYNQVPTNNNASADVVVGQSDFSTTTSSTSNMKAPRGMAIYNGKLLVADYNNYRVLIWNNVPTTNTVNADVVIGQNSVTSGSQTQPPTASTVSKPYDVIVVNGKVIVADQQQNNRILIWNSIPTSNNASADIVIGQTNFANQSTNQGGTPAANTLSGPAGVSSDGTRLYVADRANNRILIFNSIPTSNNASADIVLGQSGFTNNSANGGTVNNKGFNNPYAVYMSSSHNKLFVSSLDNNRILIFNDINNVPRLGISSLGGVPLNTANAPEQGRLRISGNLSVDGGLYNLWKLEASVNGGGYAPVTSLSNSVTTNSTHDPSKTDTVSSTFYHDFEPWNLNGQPLGNGAKDDWITKQSEMLSSHGYTLKLKGYTNNTDTNPIFFLSKPLTIISPTNTTPEGNATAVQLPTLSRNPTITFSVNSKQRNELKENLVHYEVWMKPTSSVGDQSNTDWSKYIDSIPIDYDTVRDYEDNLRKGTFDGNKDEGNGTYENNNLIVTFTKNSSEISVRKKGQSLSSGIYQMKVVAVDKANHPQDSDNEITVKIIGSPQVNNPKNLAITNEWFPLQINSISGIQTNRIINQDTTQTTFQTSTSNPTIQGIAFSGSIITLTITDSFSGEYRTYTTTAKDSTWTIAPQLYPSTSSGQVPTSFLDVSVESVEGKYNELPTVTVNTGR